MNHPQAPAPMPAHFRRQSHPARAIPCPHCKAPIGQPCTVPSNGKTLKDQVSHDARTQALAPAAPVGTGTWPTRAAS